MREKKYSSLDLGINQVYAKEFIEKNNSTTNMCCVYEILQIEDEVGKSLIEWDLPEFKKFLTMVKSISIMSLNFKMTIFRKFASYVAKKENLPEKSFAIPDNFFITCIDMKRLLTLTISPEQYNHIKNVLSIKNNDNKKINVRDKVIFQLAWHGLSIDEIKYLKTENIEFKGNKVILTFDDKVIKIDDKELADDIKVVMEERVYYIFTKDGKERFIEYKNSEYLLKPMRIGRSKSTTSTHISNPSIMLQNIFANALNPVICDGIDMPSLGIDDIRRSKIIYLLSQQEYIDPTLITVMFDLKTDSGLYWLRKVAEIKYPKCKIKRSTNER